VLTSTGQRTREQGSFDWFKGVINEVDDLDQRVNTNVNSLASRVLFFVEISLINCQLIWTLIRVSLRCTTT
jgi:hypothetical protein